MKTRVISEFTSELPEKTVEAIDIFNDHLETDPESVRRTLARKVFSKLTGENPEIDRAITNLLQAKQDGERPFTLGFEPTEFAWGEIWREENYKKALSTQNQLEAALTGLTAGTTTLAGDSITKEAYQREIEDTEAGIAEVKASRRVIALGVVAHINTARYAGPDAPLNFIDANDLISGSQTYKAA
jgi:hypothetical protein